MQNTNKKKHLSNESSSVVKDKKIMSETEDNLRHHGDFNDLQSTCVTLKSENEKLRVELESKSDIVKEQETKIEILTAGGHEAAKKIKASEDANVKTELVQRKKESQENFKNLVDDLTPKPGDSFSSGDSTIEMILMEKNVSMIELL